MQQEKLEKERKMKITKLSLITVVLSLLISQKGWSQFRSSAIFHEEGVLRIENLQVSVVEGQSDFVGDMPYYLSFEFRTSTASTTTDFVLKSSDDNSELFLYGLRPKLSTGGPGSAPIHQLKFLCVPKISKRDASGNFIWLCKEGVPTTISTAFGRYQVTATFTLFSQTDRPGLGFKIENVHTTVIN